MMLRRMLPVIGMMLLSLVGGVLGGALTETWVAGRVSAAEVAGVQASEVVTTRQINLVDASGALRAILSARDERGMASLAFYDFEGQVRSVVGLENTGRPFLRFLTSDGRRRLQATLENDDALVIAGDESDRAGMFGDHRRQPSHELRCGRGEPSPAPAQPGRTARIWGSSTPKGAAGRRWCSMRAKRRCSRSTSRGFPGPRSASCRTRRCSTWGTPPKRVSSWESMPTGSPA